MYKGLSSWHGGLNITINRPQCLVGWWADGSRRPGFKSRSGRGFFRLIRLAGNGHDMRSNSRTDTKGSPMSSLNCDKPLLSRIRAPRDRNEYEW